MIKGKLTPEEAVILLDQIPSIFPSASEVQAILDQVVDSCILEKQHPEVAKVLAWWRGWVAADDHLMSSSGKRPDVLTSMVNAFNAQAVSPVTRVVWRSGFRTRFTFNSKIIKMRKNNE